MVVVKQHPTHRSIPLPKSKSIRENNSGLSSFWNACGDVRNACTPTGGTNTIAQPFVNCAVTPVTQQLRSDGIDAYTSNVNNDDDSIIEQDPPQPPHQHSMPFIPQPPATTTAPHQRVRNLMDGFIAPFLQCVQPPIQACITPVESWDHPSVDTTMMNDNNSRTHSNNSKEKEEEQLPYVASDQWNYTTTNNNKNNNTGNYQKTTTNSSRIRDTVSHPENFVSTKAKSTGCAHINDNDVLCGRGNGVNKHIGNVRFRELIAANKDDYATLFKKEKMMWAREIVDLVLYHTDPPGRFVARDNESGLWHDIGLSRSLEKTSQALREKSAAERVADKDAGMTNSSNDMNNNHLRIVTSFDENEVDDIEVAPTTDQLGESSKASSSLNRTTTITFQTNRNKNHHGKTTMARPYVPDHLRNVYKKNPSLPQQQFHSIPLPPSAYPPVTSSPQHQITTRLSMQQQQQVAYRGQLGLPTFPPPYIPTFHGPEISNNVQMRRQFQPSHPPFFVSKPPPNPSTRNLVMVHQHQQRPTSFPSVPLVTPSGKSNIYYPAPPLTPKKEDHPFVPSAIVSERQSLSAIWNHDVIVDDECKSPIFPSNVFQNRLYGMEVVPSVSHNNVNRYNDEIAREEVINAVAISPSREQAFPKRQRVSNNNLLDISLDSACIEIDTSLDSIETTLDVLHDENFTSLAVVHNNNATTSAATTTTHRLVEAIGSQLTLEDKVIRSPSEIIQTYTRGRSFTTTGGHHRRQKAAGTVAIEPLPRPCKATGPLDISADSMDGLAALSTAAYLRLDESY